MIPLFLDALAAFRLTKLVVDDTLTAEVRDAVVRAAYESAGRREQTEREHPEVVDSPLPDVWATCVVPNDPDPPKLATLVTCPWCSGIWVSLGVVIARRIAPKAWRPIAEALALSAVVGMLAKAVEA